MNLITKFKNAVTSDRAQKTYHAIGGAVSGIVGALILSQLDFSNFDLLSTTYEGSIETQGAAAQLVTAMASLGLSCAAFSKVLPASDTQGPTNTPN